MNKELPIVKDAQRFYAYATVSDIVLREEAIYVNDPLINRTNIERKISSVSTCWK